MFIEVNPIDGCGDILLNLDHVTEIARTTATTVTFTDIHKNKIVCVYTVELANIMEHLKRLGQL